MEITEVSRRPSATRSRRSSSRSSAVARSSSRASGRSASCRAAVSSPSPASSSRSPPPPSCSGSTRWRRSRSRSWRACSRMVAATSTLRVAHTRAVGALLALLALSGLLRPIGWELTALAGERASLGLYHAGRAFATLTVAVQAFAALLAAAWLGTRSRVRGRMLANAAIVMAFAITYLAARDSGDTPSASRPSCAARSRSRPACPCPTRSAASRRSSFPRRSCSRSSRSCSARSPLPSSPLSASRSSRRARSMCRSRARDHRRRPVGDARDDRRPIAVGRDGPASATASAPAAGQPTEACGRAS